MSDLHLQSMRLLSKRKPIFTHNTLTIQDDRKLDSRHFDTINKPYIAMKSANFFLYLACRQLKKPKKFDFIFISICLK